MPTPRQITILGERWKLVHRDLRKEKCRGLCEKNPDGTGKTITICTSIKSQEELLEILIHEFWHGIDWWKDEEFIAQAAKDLSRFLSRYGYRLVREGEGSENE